MKVYLIRNGYDDGYERWERDFDTDTFLNKEDAERAVEHLIKMQDGDNHGDYYCETQKETVFESFDQWKAHYEGHQG